MWLFMLMRQQGAGSAICFEFVLMRINEIFYSLQGEGYWTGTPAVFVRFSGCNLKCGFCDTEHGGFVDMSEEEIVAAVNSFPARHVVLTGGEPTLQISVSLLSRLKGYGKYVQIETNGTIPVSEKALEMIDWVTCSPKDMPVVIGRVDEVKMVFENPQQDMDYATRLAANHGAVAMLQPCDVKDGLRNREIVSAAVEYVKSHPVWRLSLQTHKMLDIR